MRFILLLLIVLCACSKKEKDQSAPIKNPDGTTTVRAYYKNKKVRSEQSFKGDKRHGMSRTYNEQGQVILELPYADDLRNGQSKRYYETGQVYQTTEYVNDTIHGSLVKYRSNGALSSEARYEKALPCLGLKEYLEDGTLKKKYPKIVIKVVDKVGESGEYLINVSMSEKVKKVHYYTGELSPSGCVYENNKWILLDEVEKTGRINYSVMPSRYATNELNIVAVVETILGNEYVTQQKFKVGSR